jgi:23S rRNA pseudouridine1911/1915/1917 synthase
VVSRQLGVSRGDVQRAIGRGRVLVDGRVRAKSFRLTGGETVLARLQEAGELEPDPRPVPVLFEDEHLLVVSKPAGVLTHPTASRRSDTLVNRLLGMGTRLAPGGAEGANDRPGIVHRLDAGTSGLLLVAKTDQAHAALSRMLRAHSVDRRYLAFIRGRPAHQRFLIEAPMERRGARIVVSGVRGKDAATEIELRERFDGAALVEARPRTGRTHQIRVHLAAVGHPILGDRAYGGVGADSQRLGLERPFLHSWQVAFDHPITGQHLEIEDPLPDDLVRALERARSTAG